MVLPTVDDNVYAGVDDQEEVGEVGQEDTPENTSYRQAKTRYDRKIRIPICNMEKVRPCNQRQCKCLVLG